MDFPKRHPNHTIEEKSFIFFKQHLPGDWNPNSIDRDYGQDLNIEIAEDGRYMGREFIVQLKASHLPTIVGENETQVFSVATYNYLKGNVRVVLIVKYIESEDEAYWILLKDIPPPSQENQTFTIHIPRVNRLSNFDWQILVDHVKMVTKRKLDAMNDPEP